MRGRKREGGREGGRGLGLGYINLYYTTPVYILKIIIILIKKRSQDDTALTVKIGQQRLALCRTSRAAGHAESPRLARTMSVAHSLRHRQLNRRQPPVQRSPHSLPRDESGNGGR